MLKESDKSVVQKLETSMTENEDEVRCGAYCSLSSLFVKVLLSWYLDRLSEGGLGCEKGLRGTGWSESLASPLLGGRLSP